MISRSSIENSYCKYIMSVVRKNSTEMWYSVLNIFFQLNFKTTKFRLYDCGNFFLYVGVKYSHLCFVKEFCIHSI